MSVLSINPTWDRESTQTRDWKRTYRTTWKIETSNPQDDALLVRTTLTAWVGKFGAFYQAPDGAQDTGSWINSINVKCSAPDGKQWIGTIEYAPYDPSQFPEDPLKQPAEMSWEFVQDKKVAEEDQDGNPVVNSAGDPFDPPIEYDFSRPILTIVQNQQDFDPDSAEDWNDSLNDDVWMGFDQHTVKVSNITGPRKWDQNIGWYWTVTYQFHFNFDGWVFEIADMGMRVLADDDKPANVYSPTPVYLDGAGKQLADDAEAVYQKFHIYKERHFDDLPLKQDVLLSLMTGAS